MATEIASSGLFRYPPKMADPEINEIEAAEQAYDAYGKLPYLDDLHAKIEDDLTSGKSLAELPAWESTE